MRKLFFILFSVATLSSASYAENVLVINNSDHRVAIHSYHDWLLKRVRDRLWSWVSGTDSGQTTIFSVEPHSTTRIFVKDAGNTTVTFYRMSLTNALNNIVWLGTTYAGSTALTAANAFAWFPAAVVAAKTTWNGLPFSKQVVNVDQPTEEGRTRAILIENYEKNKETIQTKQGIVELQFITHAIIEDIQKGIFLLRENSEFLDGNDDLIQKEKQLLIQAAGQKPLDWDVYDSAQQLKEEVNTLLQAQTAALQQKSIPDILKDLAVLLTEFPALKKEYEALKQKSGAAFYLDLAKFLQSLNALRDQQEVDKSKKEASASESSSEEDSEEMTSTESSSSSSSSSSSEEE